jgi:hypothetical protein
MADAAPTAARHNNHEQALADFLADGRPPTIGNMSYLLRPPGGGASELATSLHQYIAGLSNSEFLTSGKFVKRGLQRVINKYRNGGVHDAPIAESVCRECIDDLVGTLSKPGFIPVVASWRDTG